MKLGHVSIKFHSDYDAGLKKKTFVHYHFYEGRLVLFLELYGIDFFSLIGENRSFLLICTGVL